MESDSDRGAVVLEGDGRDRPSKVGRKRDGTLDARILDAALGVLAEVGYDGLTMDMVAERARVGKATLYRRWSSKEDMVLDAVAGMKRDQVDITRLPDTGTLRGDLLGLFRPHSIEESERRLRIMAGLSSMLSRHGGLSEAGNAAVVKPWADAHRVLIQRAAERGEISADADIETASQVIPSMAAYRAMIEHKKFDREFLVSLIDGVLLPALRREPEKTRETNS